MPFSAMSLISTRTSPVDCLTSVPMVLLSLQRSGSQKANNSLLQDQLHMRCYVKHLVRTTLSKQSSKHPLFPGGISFLCKSICPQDVAILISWNAIQ
ncbi:hypothetical protein P5673_024428, partial [Acropora cervicornis]